MNNIVVEKYGEKYGEKSVETMWGKYVEKETFVSFPYKSTNFSAKNHTNSTTISTWFSSKLSLLKMSFPHFPHSLLLLLLNN